MQYLIHISFYCLFFCLLIAAWLERERMFNIGDRVRIVKFGGTNTEAYPNGCEGVVIGNEGYIDVEIKINNPLAPRNPVWHCLEDEIAKI